MHDGVLHLTFDDGPDSSGTPPLLDLLAELGAGATFFVVGPRAAAHPELISRMRAAGHAVELHCDEHVRHSQRTREWIECDTDRALAKLGRLGVRPRLWRTPWGDTAACTTEIAHAHELRLQHWTVDTHDWRGDGAPAMFDATAAGLVDGAVVLAHDGIGPGARRDDVSQTLAYVALVAEEAHRRRLSLEALR